MRAVFDGKRVVAADFVLERVGGGTGGTGDRALERDAAVGLLNLSDALVVLVDFLTGVAGVDAACALRDLAKEAAVGAKSPEEGVFGRDAAAALAVDRAVILVGEVAFLAEAVEAVDKPV